MVGKNVHGKLYVHRSAESKIPTEMRRIVSAAKRKIKGARYDLVKLDLKDLDSGVSFLFYDDFEGERHPAILTSVRVTSAPEAAIRDYSKMANPPILHRKETFVGAGHPLYEKFLAETEEEEELGLLDHPPGNLHQWEKFVRERVPQAVANRILERG